jgi:hypothetical protein
MTLVALLREGMGIGGTAQRTGVPVSTVSDMKAKAA